MLAKDIPLLVFRPIFWGVFDDEGGDVDPGRKPLVHGYQQVEHRSAGVLGSRTRTFHE